MKIAYDHQIFSIERYGGISRYFSELAQELAKRGHSPKIFAGLHQNQYLPTLDSALYKGRAVRQFPKRSTRIATHANRPFTSRQIQRWQPDVLHLTYYDWPAFVPSFKPTVLTVHDMVHELQPQYFNKSEALSARKKAAISHADHVICISQNTKSDLQNLLDVPGEKISVVHHGVSPRNLQGDGEVVTTKPFILYVGARSGYKNFEGLLRAVSIDPEMARDFEIVAFGGKPFSVAERALISTMGFDSDQVRQIGGDDELLDAYFRTAALFVYPSLYEGFGFPPLEAMQNGCPVASSNTSSMPEVIGEAAEFFDPAHPEDISQSLRRVLYSDARKDALIELGFRQAKKFTWANCADQTIQTYRKLL